MASLYETVGALRRGALFTFHLRTRTVDWTTWEQLYQKGLRPARHPVPAIPVTTGYMPTGTNGMRGIPYIWLMYGYNRLTTFWKGHDTVVEWFDTDGKRHLRREVSMRRET